MASHQAVRDALAAHPTAGADQQAMVRDLCQGGQGVAVVVGRAGTGKTFALGIARHVWQLDGYRLLAAAPTGIATVSLQGRPGRFPDADHFASYTGLVPGAFQTGTTDRKGQPITKAGNRKLRRMLYQAADTARKHDPQLARIYYLQMVERGANHTKALTVVAAHLARRLWRVLERQRPYVVCDLDGRPVTPEEATQLIAERYTVPEGIRRRRRASNKAGKAPHQVLEGHAVKPSAQDAGSTRRPSPIPILLGAPS